MPDEAPPSGAASGAGGETVGDIAQLYLGNILFALERCAMTFDDEGKPLDAAFYRGIGRKLADAHGRSKSAAP